MNMVYGLSIFGIGAILLSVTGAFFKRQGSGKPDDLEVTVEVVGVLITGLFVVGLCLVVFGAASWMEAGAGNSAAGVLIATTAVTVGLVWLVHRATPRMRSAPNETAVVGQAAAHVTTPVPTMPGLAVGLVRPDPPRAA